MASMQGGGVRLALWGCLRHAFLHLSLWTRGRAAPDKAVPKGHLEPFGGWREGKPLMEWSTVPTPEEFYKHCTKDNGASEPVLLRGAANGMAAMKWTNDDYMLEKYANARITGVEYNLKETRAGGNVAGMNTLKDFLGQYNKTDIYMVSKVPKEMKKDAQFLPCLGCGGFLNFLDVANMWMGRGGSKSVIHYDDQDNINCMFSGSKRFSFMSPKYKERFEAHPNTKRNKFGWVDTDLDRKIPGYGAFMGKVDVTKMDLITYPGWKDIEWSYAELQPGDCLYIPYQWYHTVAAAPMRSINMHIWYWRPKNFDSKSCDRAGSDQETPLTFADCQWGYEPPGGHLGVITKKGKKPTKCRSTKAKKAKVSDGSARADL